VVGGPDDGGGDEGQAVADGGSFSSEAGAGRSGLTVSVSPTSAAVCPGECVTLTASASGGVAPYSYTWSSAAGTGAAVRVCPRSTTTYMVATTDSSGHAGDLVQSSLTGTGHVAVTVSTACADGAVATLPDAGECAGGATDITTTGTTLPQSLTIDVKGSVRYFANGTDLPAGMYRVAYVDGCLEFGAEASGYYWTINDPGVYSGQQSTIISDPGSCVLVGGSSMALIGALPGETSTGLQAYASCVAASKSAAPLDFQFSSGKLGIYVNDSLTADNIGGEGQCGVSPTWQLSAL
jgi:hypothetical protein